MVVPIVAGMVARIAMTGLRLAMQVAKQASKMASKGKGRGKIKGKGGLLSGSDSGYNDIQGTGNYSDLYSYTANNQSEKAEAHKDNLKEINRLTDNIQKELIQKIQKQIGKDDITFTGNLRQNIKPDFEGDFKAVSAETHYAWFVEFGLPPGKWVNFDALMIWVEGKLGITDEQEARIVTSKILKKINRDGIAPKRFMKKGIKSLISKRGAIVTRRRSSSKTSNSQLSKTLNRVSKQVKTINKYLKKGDKIMSKVGAIK